jgi:hypothetical protein
MKEIDWSKAPEGATQYDCGSQWPWEKVLGEDLYYYSDSAKWTLVSGYAARCDARMGLIKRPMDAPWNGEGLPPVGTVCEIQQEIWSDANWQKVTIKYASTEYFITEDGAGQQHWHARSVQLRPIRTPEQIAADERSLVIDDMVKALGMENPGTAEYIRCGLIYDAGYRKL